MLSLMLFAQEAITMPDSQASVAQAITVLIPIIVPFVVWGARLAIPKIPRAVLPALAVGAGVGVEALVSWISGGQWSPMTGAILGALGVFAREFATTIKQHGMSA